MKGHILYCTEWPQDRADVVVQCGRTIKSARAVMKADYDPPSSGYWISPVVAHILVGPDFRNVCRDCRVVAVPKGKHYQAIMVSGEDYMTLESQRAELPAQG